MDSQLMPSKTVFLDFFTALVTFDPRREIVKILYVVRNVSPDYDSFT